MTESKTFVKMEHGDCESDPDAAVAQSVERHIGNVEVTGSIPVSSSLKPLEDEGFQGASSLRKEAVKEDGWEKTRWKKEGP